MKTPFYEPPKTWEWRLAHGKLTEQEWLVLKEMVESGQADSLEEAARMMDFLEREENLEDSFESD